MNAHRSPFRLKRVYLPPDDSDGTRVLVDRLWPRGLTKEKAAVAVWLRDVAPSAELRRWFGHELERWDEFQVRYRSELGGNPAVGQLVELGRKGPVTLVFGAHDETHNQAVVLADYLAERMEKADGRSDG